MGPALGHLYVHIPFCRSRCAYCDFASEPIGRHARAGRVERYLESLRAELAARGGTGAGHVGGLFETIYLGGGTPTALPADVLVGLVEDLAGRLGGPRDRVLGGAPPPGAMPSAAPPPEFTIEANPGTVDAPLLERLRSAGVTRLSLGVQSFAPALRAALGRRVTQREITDALAAIAATDWQEWNLDLVFGIPGQTWNEAAADVDAAVAAGPTHISLYDLTYTPEFEMRVNAGQVGAGPGAGEAAGAGAWGAAGTSEAATCKGAAAGETVTAREAAGAFAEQHYADVVARLQTAGYQRYEVSNFALPGHECRHNQAYWRGEDYLGIGASAVSTITMAAPGAPREVASGVSDVMGGAALVAAAERRTNPRSVADYLAGQPPEIEMLTPEMRLWERAMLGLRTSEGVDEAAVLPVLDEAARDRLLSQGCVERRYGRLRLNPGFLDVSNTLIGALLVRPGWS